MPMGLTKIRRFTRYMMTSGKYDNQQQFINETMGRRNSREVFIQQPV
jgi:hypothetical protein